MEVSPQPQGILLVDKPLEMTSFRAVQIAAKQLSRELGVKRVKVGHAGTLDPLASGLLVVAVGRATKKLAELTLLSKTYDATVLFGEATETLDAEGAVLEEKSAHHLSVAQVVHALGAIMGKQEYAVPLYSAIKVDGKPLYWYARNKKTPPRIPKKEMEVLSAEVDKDSWKKLLRGRCEATIRMEVSKGTYIRTLAEALGRSLDLPARLSGLRRVSVGDFRVEKAREPDDVTIGDIQAI